MGFKHVTELTKIGDKPTFFGYFNIQKYHMIKRYRDSLKLKNK